MHVEYKRSTFFDNENIFNSNTPDYSYYHSYFSPQLEHTMVGEATPIYMYWNDAPKRMWQYNPDMKLIILLRNPIDRAYSYWNMEHSRNTDSSSFWNAIQNEQERCREALPYQHRFYSYIDRGFYLMQLRKLWTYFPKDRVLIIKNEYLKNQRHKALRDVCEFLKVDHFNNVENKNVHSLSYESKMNEKERKYLRSIFEYEISEIVRVLGRNYSDWLSK